MSHTEAGLDIRFRNERELDPQTCGDLETRIRSIFDGVCQNKGLLFSGEVRIRADLCNDGAEHAEDVRIVNGSWKQMEMSISLPREGVIHVYLCHLQFTDDSVMDQVGKEPQQPVKIARKGGCGFSDDELVVPGDKNRRKTGAEVSEASVKKKGDDVNAILETAMATGSESRDVPVSKIRRFKAQPRLSFNKTSLLELGESLSVVQVMPVLVRELSEDEKKSDPDGAVYELIDGERRWRACALVGKEYIRIVVLVIPDVDTQFAISAIANFGREEHTPIEEARALQYMCDTFGLSVKVAAKSFAKSDAWGYQRVALLKLDPRVQALLDPNLSTSKRLNIGVAAHLSHIDDLEFQVEVAQHILDRNLTAAGAKRYINIEAKKRGHEVKESKEVVGPVHNRRVLMSLFDVLATKLEVLGSASDGVIAAMATSDADRNQLRAILGSLINKLQALYEKLG